MSRRNKNNNDNAPGSDSFLDIVANMVGIMIILVMVVGIQAKDAFVAEAKPVDVELTPVALNEPSIDETELAKQRRQVGGLKAEVDDLAKSTASVQQEAKSRFELRNQLQQLAVAAERLIQEEKSKLDQSQQADFDTRRQLQAARDELEDLSSKRLAVENSAAPVVVLKHLPTPLAKTVFGQEEHFRLSGGRLVYVPMNQLVAEMKQQAQLKVYKLKQAPEITEIVGPIGGFTMQYRLIRRKVSVRGSGGMSVREAVDLAGFVLVPGSANLGEPVDEALGENSQFRQRLRQMDPNTTTITIWTYPDSFGDFRRVKDDLYGRGFLTAGRPLPEGTPIGGSPNGTRSGAQ